MPKVVRRLAPVASVLLFIGLCTYVALAAITLSTTSPYTQSFDGIGTAATATLPADFRVDKPATVRTVGTFAAAATATSLLGGANLSSTASNGIYNFGAGTTTTGPDRAVGFLSSGTATASGNLYAQLVNNTGAALTGLQISYNVEKYRGGSNAAGFRIQLFYSADGATWTSAGSNFLTSFAADASNTGFSPAPGLTVPISNQTLNVSVPNGGNFYLAWNYSVSSGSTTTNAQALAVDDISILGLANTPTNPTGLGAANPSSVQAGTSTLLTVAVTPGANPTSTGLAVSADLSSIGGSTSQQFFDDGVHGGDVTAGDNIFSFLASVPVATSNGSKSLPATITDAQSRTGSTTIALTVTPSSIPPSGVGAASPNSLPAGATTLLTVKVTPGTNPVSTGVTVTGDLTTIGGLASQAFVDNGTSGDVTANDGIFSFAATIANGTTPGAKSLPTTITDAQSRTGSATIALTVQPPPPPTTVKISQLYGGGGNSGSTYTNDFIEIYNQASTPVDLAGWSVRYASAAQTTAWTATNICPSPPCLLAPGHYYLVQESAGTGGTTQLPAADATGTIAMSGTNAKVALVADTNPLTGGCPTGGAIVDLVGYGTATCFETAATPALSNLTAAVRRGNGCVDTDNNAGDFVIIGPIPRNSASPANSCGGDPAQLSGLGIASPSSLDPASNTLLTVIVAPAITPPSTGVAVAADLTSIGGAALQPFYDDGTHGDATAGDNVFSYQATVGAFISTGVKSVVAAVTDAQGRTATVPTTLTITSPTCGVERWSVKTGTDADAALVNLLNPFPTTISALRAFAAPPDPPGPPLNARIAPAETTVAVVNATMMLFKLETDVDYHIVLQDSNGQTIIAEIPSPACVGQSSPFGPRVAASRAKFDSMFAATPFFQSVSVPVQVTGVGFFDFIHGQTGVAPNGIELHPVLEINFTANSTTTLQSSANPSQYGQLVTLTTIVSNGGSSVPTGTVTLLDGGNAIDSRALDAGQAVFTTTTLAAGTHVLTVAYGGDSASAPSTSAELPEVVNKADQTIAFGPLGGKIFGAADFDVAASTSSGLPASFSIVSGPATVFGSSVHITGAGSVTVRASQPGDSNYNAAPDADASFVVAKAPQTITFPNPPGKTYGDAPFTVSGSGGGSGNPVTFSATGTCASGGVNGSTISITGAGSCNITASQAGDSNYDAALDVSRSVTINPARATITVNGYSGVYDGHAHGAGGTASGVNGEDLTSLLNFGATFTDAPGGTAHWTFAGNVNYAPASGDVTIAISRSALTIRVTGFSGPYDGQPHGATGGASGINGEDLRSLLDLGATFTNVPGGTATWSFAGNNDYLPDSGTANIVITRVTPSLSNLSSPVISDTVPSVSLGGTISLGALTPTGVVAITLNSVTQNASIQSGGGFSSSFTSPPPANLPYSIVYNYVGDGNFNATSGTGTLTVNDTTPPTIAPHADVVAEATSAAGAVVTYSAPATMDAVDGPGVATCAPASGNAFHLGATVVTCNASDAHHNAAVPTTFMVTVRDTTAPSVPTLSVNPGVLWPPDHRMVPVTVTAHATDAVTAAPVCSITGITVNDDDGVFAITGPLTANLKAEKIQDDEALIYRLTVSCKDTAGNVGPPASINVVVPHDQGGEDRH